MSDTRLGVYGSDFQSPKWTCTQFVIPAGAGATYAWANNIATLTFNAAHGLTFNPAAGVPGNYLISFGGSTSGLTGTGVLVGNIFRILSIPSTTSITFASTVTAATVTSLTGIPVFASPYSANVNSVWGAAQLTQSGVSYPPNQFYAADINYNFGANCTVQWNTDGTFVILDGSNVGTLGTPATAPAFTTVGAASTAGQLWVPPTNTLIFASGTTATSVWQVMN
jgi:hypothetical protein